MGIVERSIENTEARRVKPPDRDAVALTAQRDATVPALKDACQQTRIAADAAKERATNSGPRLLRMPWTLRARCNRIGTGNAPMRPVPRKSFRLALGGVKGQQELNAGGHEI